MSAGNWIEGETAMKVRCIYIYRRSSVSNVRYLIWRGNFLTSWVGSRREESRREGSRREGSRVEAVRFVLESLVGVSIVDVDESVCFVVWMYRDTF